MKKPPVRIVFAAECPPCPNCGEPWCRKHRMHYADCPCLGPSQAEDLGAKIINRRAILP